MKPGDLAEAEVQMDTQGIQGPLDKEFFAVTDSGDPKLANIPFRLSVNVLRPIEAIPSALNFGNANPTSEIRKSIRILVRSQDLLETFQGISTNSEEVTLSVVRQQPGLITVDAQLIDGLSDGDLTGMATLNFDHEQFHQFKLPIAGRIDTDIQCIPRRIDFSGSWQTSQRLRIKSKRGQAFCIHEIRCPPEIRIEAFDESLHSDTHFISLAKSELLSSSDSQFVVLLTDHPDQTLIRIPIQKSELPH